MSLQARANKAKDPYKIMAARRAGHIPATLAIRVGAYFFYSLKFFFFLIFVYG